MILGRYLVIEYLDPGGQVGGLDVATCGPEYKIHTQHNMAFQMV